MDEDIQKVDDYINKSKKAKIRKRIMEYIESHEVSAKSVWRDSHGQKESHEKTDDEIANDILARIFN